jgi:hypothetical protein
MVESPRPDAGVSFASHLLTRPPRTRIPLRVIQVMPARRAYPHHGPR